MRHARALAAPLALSVLALAGCPGASSNGTTMQTAAPAAAATRASSPPPPPAPLDPFEDVQVGQVYVFRIDYGRPVTERRAVKSKTRDGLVVSIEGQDTPVGISPRQPLDVRVPRVEHAPAAGTLLGNETLTVSGIAFACEVREEDDAENPGNKVQVWVAKKYPRRIKKVAAGKTILELVAIEQP